MIQPINDRVIVRLFTPEQTAEGHQVPDNAYLRSLGFAIPDVAKDKDVVCGKMIVYNEYAHRGEVVAVGPGKWLPPCKKCGRDNLVRRPLSIKVGDVIQFGRYADFVDQEQNLVIIQEDDVVGVEEPVLA